MFRKSLLFVAITNDLYCLSLSTSFSTPISTQEMFTASMTTIIAPTISPILKNTYFGTNIEIDEVDDMCFIIRLY